LHNVPAGNVVAVEGVVSIMYALIRRVGRDAVLARHLNVDFLARHFALTD